MANPVYVSNSEVHRDNASSTSLVADRPATVNAGDLLVIHVAFRSSTNLTADPTPGSTGWTTIARQTSSTLGIQAWVAWKIATGSEPGPSAAYSWTLSSAQTQTVTIFRVTGADATTPKDSGSVSVGSSAGGTTMTASSATPSGLERLFVALFNNISSTTYSATTPATMTTEWFHSAGTGTTIRSSGGYSEALASSSATGTRAVTSGSSAWTAQSVLIVPAAGGGGATTSLVIPSETVQRKLMRR